MSKGITIGIIFASALFTAASAFAADSGDRVIKVEGRRTVWAEKKESAPYAVMGRRAAAESDDFRADLRAFGRSGCPRR